MFTSRARGQTVWMEGLSLHEELASRVCPSPVDVNESYPASQGHTLTVKPGE